MNYGQQEKKNLQKQEIFGFSGGIFIIKSTINVLKGHGVRTVDPIVVFRSISTPADGHSPHIFSIFFGTFYVRSY